jgi:hypothetical protein
MKKLYEEQKHSIYYLQKELGLAPYSLYYYTTKYKIENMPLKLVLDIAYIEKVEPNWLLGRMLEYEKRNKKYNASGNEISK